MLEPGPPTSRGIARVTFLSHVVHPHQLVQKWRCHDFIGIITTISPHLVPPPPIPLPVDCCFAALFVAEQYLILDGSCIHDLDSSAINMLEALVALLVDRQPPVEVFVAPVSDPLMLQIHKSPMLSATLGRRYFLGIAPAVQYASEQVAAGMLIAPSDKCHRVMSNLSLGHVDETQLEDI